MNIDYIKDTLSKLNSIVEQWSNDGQVSEIERSLAMDKLKQVFEALMFLQPSTLSSQESKKVGEELKDMPDDEAVGHEPKSASMSEIEAESSVSPESVPEQVVVLPKIPLYDISDNEFSTDFTLNQADDNHSKIVEANEQPNSFFSPVEDEPTEINKTEVEVANNQTPKSEQEAVNESKDDVKHDTVQKPKEVAEPTIFDSFSRSNKLNERTIRSLYDDDDDANEDLLPFKKLLDVEEPISDKVQQTTSQPISHVAESEPKSDSESESVDKTDVGVEEQPDMSLFADQQPITVLGEVISTGKTTFAESMAATNESDLASRIATAEAETIRGSIGINDKFLLIRDLFAGDQAAYEQTISRLESFDNLEDAMLYIHDNFKWNQSSDGAKLLVDIIARKLM